MSLFGILRSPILERLSPRFPLSSHHQHPSTLCSDRSALFYSHLPPTNVSTTTSSMAPSTVQFPPAQERSQQSPNTRADQIVWRYFNKVVLTVAHARTLYPDSQDPQDAPAPGLPVGDYDEGGGTPTGSISVAAPTPSSTTQGSSAAGPSRAPARARADGPKVDKWVRLIALERACGHSTARTAHQ